METMYDITDGSTGETLKGGLSLDDALCWMRLHRWRLDFVSAQCSTIFVKRPGA
jgi:hypothetical protein